MSAGVSAKAQSVIDQIETYAAHNYAPIPVVIESAEGSWMTDVEGRRYLDCLSAYSAMNFGHNHPKLVKAAIEQMQKVSLTSRAFYAAEFGPFAQALCELVGMEMMLPMNTGAEAVETGIKLARKWGYQSKGVPDDQAHIIGMADNFHGRTTTIVSLSNDENARADYGPYMPGLTSVPFGDIAALEAAITPHTVAVLLEPIQGEAGVILPPPGFLAAVRELTVKHNVLMVVDEIQTGMGRTGSTLYCEQVGVEPDIYLLGKALGGGIVPLSAVVGSREVIGLLQPGQHGSTFGGNPLACAVGSAVIDMLNTGEMQERSRTLGLKLADGLDELLGKGVTAYRCIGLWAGIDIDPDVATGREVCERLMRRGLLVKDTHQQTVRLAPPLVITEAELDWALGEITATLAELTA